MGIQLSELHGYPQPPFLLYYVDVLLNKLIDKLIYYTHVFHLSSLTVFCCYLPPQYG